MDILAKRIKAARKLRKLSQEELANQLGVNVYSVSKWETGIRRPDYEHLDGLAELLDVDLSYLLGQTDNPGHNAINEIEKEQLALATILDYANEYVGKYLSLSGESRDIVDKMIDAMYRRDQSHGELNLAVFKHKVEWNSVALKSLDSEKLGGKKDNK